MLPLLSRTSWRLRALTVTCLPRDWTRAGFYHFANNRRRGHDLPEGHHGELLEQAWATRHTRQSSGPADHRAAAGVTRTPGPIRSGRTRDAAGTVTSLDQLKGIPAAEARAPPRSATAATQCRQHHPRQRITNRYQLQLGKSDPAPGNTLATASVLGQAGPGVLQALQEPESPPWAIRQAGMCGRRCCPPDPGRGPNGHANERPVWSGQLSRAHSRWHRAPISVNRLAIVVSGGPPTN
jgi:hypothetical protein